uniref:Uncharacterized protein n=1 Tax=Strongyloides papillosus TaxID=174720 RepID=A0A0N5B3F1_STREA
MSSRYDNSEKADVKRRHSQDLSKMRSIQCKYNSSQRRITNLAEQIDTLSQEKRSIEEKYSILLQNHEKVLEEMSQLRMQHEESMMRAREAQIHCDNLSRINSNLNQVCQEQVGQNNVMSGNNDKDLNDAESKLREKLNNSVLLSIQKKPLQYCSYPIQQKWINSIIFAIQKTNINKIPPSGVLKKLSERIMKLANETMKQEKERERETIMLKEKETKERADQVVEMEDLDSDTNDQINEIKPLAVNKENQKGETSSRQGDDRDNSCKLM